MNKIKLSSIDDMFFEGGSINDIMGKLSQIAPRCENVRNESVGEVIIVVGGCNITTDSINAYMGKIIELNEKFKKANHYVFFVRGYNDDPSVFDDETLYLSNIRCLSDYTIVETNKVKCMCVGGQVIDSEKWYGKNLPIVYSILQNSMVSYNDTEIQKCIEDGGINCVASSELPTFLQIDERMKTSPWFEDDEECKINYFKKRARIDNVYSDIIPYVNNLEWFFASQEKSPYYDSITINSVAFNAVGTKNAPRSYLGAYRDDFLNQERIISGYV